MATQEGDEGVTLFEFATGRVVERLKQVGNTASVAFEKSGALLTYGPKGLQRWPVHSKENATKTAQETAWEIGHPDLLLPSGWPLGMAVSDDSKLIAVATRSRDGALAWHLDAPPRTVRLGPHGDTRVVAVSPDGNHVATASHSGTGPAVMVWDARTGQCKKQLPVLVAASAGFSPDRQWLVTRGGEGLRTWKVGTWEEGPPLGEGYAFTFSPDKKLVVVGTGPFLRFLDISTGKELARLEGLNQESYVTLSFSRDGTWLLGSSHDSHSVFAWNWQILRAQLAEMGLDLQSSVDAAEPVSKQSSSSPRGQE